HLAQNGYRHIAILSNSEYLSITRERMAGYRQALEDANLPFDETYVKYCPHGGMIYKEVEEAMDELMALGRKPDAIFAAADKLTTNFMRYCKARKLNIPGDMAVIGFSNLDLTELLSPPLSVVRQPAFEMGKIAAELLINMIESKRPLTVFENKILPPELVTRESSARKTAKKAKV
ncbi:MAG: substrate-binding domain-containing protein, partial [Bacteroidetes bacterium]|nr:substrate-binding domain-containing protein [Bacteroidota bacterium]